MQAFSHTNHAPLEAKRSVIDKNLVSTLYLKVLLNTFKTEHNHERTTP